MRIYAPLIGICILLSACGKPSDTETASPSASNVPTSASVTAPVATAAPTTAAKGPSLLRLTATVKDDTYQSEPSCWVTIAVENLHDKPLVVFSAAFLPTQVSTGKALTTATEFAGISAGVANVPLAPGATGNPWKQNVLRTQCSDVAVKFEGKFLCAFQGQACTPVNVEVQQQGLASVTGLGS